MVCALPNVRACQAVLGMQSMPPGHIRVEATVEHGPGANCSIVAASLQQVTVWAQQLRSACGTPHDTSAESQPALH